jgi:hypothetical protein
MGRGPIPLNLHADPEAEGSMYLRERPETASR